MKLLIDMNIPPKIADFLTEFGIDAHHWFAIGAPDAKDSEILSYAHQHGYIVLTCDLDFSALLSAAPLKKPSVIQVRTQGFQLNELAQMVATAMKLNVVALEKGAILSLDTKRVRARILPLFKE